MTYNDERVKYLLEIAATAHDLFKCFNVDLLYQYDSKDEPLTDEQLLHSRLRSLIEAEDEYTEWYNSKAFENIKIEDGTDPNHQTDHCDDCGHVFKLDSGINLRVYDERIETFSHNEYLTLCRPCRNKRGNSVR